MSDYTKLSFETREKTVYVGFGLHCEKSMTVLCETTLKELDELLDKIIEKKKAINGLVFFTHQKNCFLAGVDINLIHGMNTESNATSGAERGQAILNKLADLKIPTIACIHGVCLGGGLELALSCDRILASEESTLGLPEVKLGLLPGMGGTYRLPRRVSLAIALNMILTGKNVKAKEAKKMGLVDQLYPRERLLQMAGRHLKKRKKPFSLRHLFSRNYLVHKIIFQKAQDNVMKKTKGLYQAPLKILTIMESGMMKGRESYMIHEAQAFGELCVSHQSNNLRHLFFMIEKNKKAFFTDKSITIPQRGAVIGAGAMGGGIAWLMAEGKMHPILFDLNQKSLEGGLRQSSVNFLEMKRRKKIDLANYQRRQRSLIPQTDYKGFERMDMIVEAVVEDREVKRILFKDLEKHVREDCIITSNTSSLSIKDMAGDLANPSRFAGLHFFNPVHRMPLVEIVVHEKTEEMVVKKLYNWCLSVKKIPLIVQDGPGFLVNRILIPYLNEAMFMLEEGVSMDNLDQACINFGMPMGPCRLLDEIGIDVAAKVGKILHKALGARVASGELSEKMVNGGFLGKKNKKGFYLYSEQGKKTEGNEGISELLPHKKIKMSDDEIQKRLIYPMINEAGHLLSEKIVDKAGDVDMALVFGVGFPPFKGGLLHFADEKGLDKITDQLEIYKREINAERFNPSGYLYDLVEQKRNFYPDAS